MLRRSVSTLRYGPLTDREPLAHGFQEPRGGPEPIRKVRVNAIPCSLDTVDHKRGVHRAARLTVESA